MKKKTLVSLLTIAMCLALIAGSTYALFTSEDEINIAVTSGQVKVTATVGNLKTSSLDIDQTPGKFANGGTAVINETAHELVLTNVTPGDKATFDITVKNDSNVVIQYRLVWTISGELAEALVINNQDLDWTVWEIPATEQDKVEVINVFIELPAEFTNQELDDATISFKVEAVQGNFVFEKKVNTVEEFTETLANAQPGDVINANGLTIDVNALGASIPGGIMAYNIPGGVTIKNLAVVGSYRGGNYLMFEGSSNQEIVFENCTFEPNGSRVMGLGFSGSEGGVNSVVYNNCTFKGPVSTNFVDNPNGVATFNNCTFTKHTSGNQYVMAMGGTHIFNGCTFDYTGVTQSNIGTVTTGSINSCSDSDATYSTTVILNGCNLINCGKRTYGPNSTLTIK